MPLFNVGTKGNIFKIGEKLQKFILGPDDEELISRVKNYTNHASYATDIWGGSSSMQTLGLLREVPQMLRDPVIQSCLAAIMETSFQMNDKGKVLWPVSPYDTIKKELEEFHDKVSMSQQSITVGFNLLLYGNLPFKHYFNNGGEFDNFTPIPDFTKVVPIIVSGKTLGFMVGGQFCFPYEFSYAQLEFYKNLGGIYNSNLVQFSGSIGDGDVFGQDFQNEFVVAPSYLSTAARPWKNINIIEDALLLNRMDQSNYYRIFSVMVGGSVTSKSAIRTLNYYRNLFKKVRRVSYNASGMVQTGCLRGDTKIRLLDGTNPTIKDMFDNRESYLGKGVFTCDSMGAISSCTITDVLSIRKNASMVRVTLDNGEHFDCTPDHPCQLRDGSYKGASSLMEGDSLMPLYLKGLDKRGYVSYRDNVSGRLCLVHRMVGLNKYGDWFLKGKNVHHIDKNLSNNDFDNLIALSPFDHYNCHLPDMVKRMRYAKLKSVQKMMNSGLTPKHLASCRENVKKATKAAADKVLQFGQSEAQKVVSSRVALNNCKVITERMRSDPEYKKIVLERFTKAGHRVTIQKGLKTRRELTCVVCGKSFTRMLPPSVLKSYKVSSIDEYIKKGFITCGRPCGMKLNGIRRHSGFSGEYNHRVVSVIPLEECEDVYDLTVDSDNHNFALSVGVFVHNSGNEFEIILPKTDKQGMDVQEVSGNVDVKALKDLETQYNKLFAALKVQPSQIGFGEEQANAIGETNGQSYDRRLARTCKMLVYSVHKVIKNFDLLYLRSRGYDVTVDDWSYGTVSLSVLEDQDRASTLTTAVNNLKAIAEVLNSLQLQDYNKAYLAESILGASLSAVGVDVKEVLKIPEGQEAPNSGGGGANPPLLASKQPGVINYKKVYLTSMLDTMETVRIATGEFIDSARKSLINVQAPSMKMISSGNNVVNSSVLEDGNAYLYPDESVVDLTGLVCFINGDKEKIVEDLERVKSKKYEDMATLPFTTHILVPSSLKMTLGDFHLAGIRALGSCYINSRGEVIITDKNDLATFLYMKQSGLISCLVSRLYQVP